MKSYLNIEKKINTHIVKIPSENHNSIFVHLYLHTGALAFVVVYLKKHKQLWWMSFGMRMKAS
jgi:hypothetical protein